MSIYSHFYTYQLMLVYSSSHPYTRSAIRRTLSYPWKPVAQVMRMNAMHAHDLRTTCDDLAWLAPTGSNTSTAAIGKGTPTAPLGGAFYSGILQAAS